MADVQFCACTYLAAGCSLNLVNDQPCWQLQLQLSLWRHYRTDEWNGWLASWLAGSPAHYLLATARSDMLTVRRTCILVRSR